MQLAVAATVLAWLTVAAGLTLAVGHAWHKRAPTWLAWAHPVGATATLVCVWVAVALWTGPVNMRFNSGAALLTIAFVVGAFMFSLRVSRLPLPLLAIGLHGAVAVGGCGLLVAGL